MYTFGLTIAYTIFMGILDRLKKILIIFRINVLLILKDCIKGTNPKDSFGPLTLLDVFESPKKYQFIMEILKRRGMISEDGIWIDTRKGYKAGIVKLIRCLHHKGYFKNHTQLKNAQIRDISFNTFDTIITHGYINHIDYIDCPFIPSASTIAV